MLKSLNAEVSSSIWELSVVFFSGSVGVIKYTVCLLGVSLFSSGLDLSKVLHVEVVVGIRIGKGKGRERERVDGWITLTLPHSKLKVCYRLEAGV